MSGVDLSYIAVAYLKPYLTSKMEIFVKIFNS